MAISPKSKPDEQVRVKLDNRQITVQLKPAKPKKRKVVVSGWLLAILALLMTLVIAYAIVLMRYVFPKSIVVTQAISPNVGIAYRAPRYLSVGDENILEVSIINLNSNEPLTGTITLKFHDSAVPIIATTDNGASFLMKDLPPGGRLTKSIGIKLTKRPSEKNIYYYFQFSLSDKSSLMYHSDTNRIQSRSHYGYFLVSPIDYLRSSWAQALSVIGGTGVLGLIGNYLWGRFKQTVGWD